MHNNNNNDGPDMCIMITITIIMGRYVHNNNIQLPVIGTEAMVAVMLSVTFFLMQMKNIN